ncbi:MAG: HAD-IA family hydrolase [Oscillatoria sp. PMC 1051.18]|nr:HAD-IA family hydrolase [Oscillatoria sp. PMC 1050.18]MEC5031294.1 HAD-IA family hydrolase [Oscillatoria sp. PMC 1051.18]
MPTIAYLIYDLDGLLLNTESINAKVNQAIAARYGKIFDKSVKAKIAGRNALDSATIIVEILKIPLSPKKYLQEREKIIQKLYSQAQPLPGAVNLTKHFDRHRLPQAVATSTAKHTFALKTSRHQQWFSLFNCIVTGDDPDLKQGKPAPDIFLLAAQRLGASPEECLVFEDSLSGVQAALAAGMSVVAVPDPDIDRSLYQNADLVLNSLSEFNPEFWNLPGF